MSNPETSRYSYSDLLPYDGEFVRARDYSQRISDQNSNYSIADGLGDPGFTNIVKKGIRNTQSATLDTLNEAALLLPYREIGQTDVAIEREISELHSQLETVSEQTEAAFAEIDAITEQAIGLSPNSEKELRALAAKRKKEVRQTATNDLQSRLDLIIAERDNLASLAHISGEAWPVPQVARFDSGKTVTTFDDSTIEIVDEIPVEPVPQDHIHETVNEVKRQVDNPEASDFIVYFLSQRKGQVVTVDELSEFLYHAGNSERPAADYRSRVTTILGPKIQGERIRRMLAELSEPLQLVYGWRRTLIKTGGKIKQQGSKERIYSAIPLDTTIEESLKQPANNETGTSDEWVTELRTRTLGTVGVNSVLDAPEGVRSSEQGSPRKPASDKSKERTKKEEKWVRPLVEAVEAAIEQLIEDNVFYKPDISCKQLSRVASSNKLGTNESTRRLSEAGIISQEVSGQGPDAILTRTEVVISYVFNNFQFLLTGGNGKAAKKKALAIIHDLVEQKLTETPN